eukprot:scaffold236401_cov29-Tisochrysis_lutea.AAC.3
MCSDWPPASPIPIACLVFLQVVGRPVGDIVRRYYERKCRTDLHVGPAPFLGARPISILRLLADEREAKARKLAAQRPSTFNQHSNQAAAAMAMAVLKGDNAKNGGPGRPPTVWPTVGEIVTRSTGILVSGVYCGPASSLTLRAAMGLVP